MSKGSTMLLNKAQVRAYARRIQPMVRPGFEFTQISDRFLTDLNTKVMALVCGAIRRHPTVGKTLRDFQT